MLTLAEYLFERPWIPFGIALFWVALFVFVFRAVTSMRKARQLSERRYDVLSDTDIATYASKVDLAQRSRFDLLVRIARNSAGGILRLGHIYWAFRELDRGDAEPTSPPTLTPPRDMQLTMRQDVGAVFFRQFLYHKAAGRTMQAYEQLRAGALAKSPLCTAALASARIRGDIPGLDPDPTAVEQLERAIKVGFGAADLAFFLLDGRFLPRDIPRAISLFERAARNGWEGMDFELASIFAKGEHVAPNLERATGYLLRSGPVWRRKLSNLGISQQAWALCQLDQYHRIKAEVAAMPEAKMQRLAQAFVRDLQEQGDL